MISIFHRFVPQDRGLTDVWISSTGLWSTNSFIPNYRSCSGQDIPEKITAHAKHSMHSPWPFFVSHSSLFIILILSPHSSVFPRSPFHNGWLCFHPIAYQHELCFIFGVFERVHVCSAPTKAWYYTPENRPRTFHLVTGVFASPAHFISCIICILLASISQCAICFCDILLCFLFAPSFLSFTFDPSWCDETPCKSSLLPSAHSKRE